MNTLRLFALNIVILNVNRLNFMFNLFRTDIFSILRDNDHPTWNVFGCILRGDLQDLNDTLFLVIEVSDNLVSDYPVCISLSQSRQRFSGVWCYWEL